MGNCIGERNHRIFFLFLVSVSVLTIVITASCWRVLGESYRESAFDDNVQHLEEVEEEKSENGVLWNPASDYHPHRDYSTNNDMNNTQPFYFQAAFRTLSSHPVEVVFGIFSLLCAWSLLSLTCFHAVIITLAQTTNERVRGVFQYGGIINPADQGCWMNWLGLCCNEVPESKLPNDFSEEVKLPVRDINNYDLNGVVNANGLLSNNATRPFAEETIWPGWQYSQIFSSTSDPTTSN